MSIHKREYKGKVSYLVQVSKSFSNLEEAKEYEGRLREFISGGNSVRRPAKKQDSKSPEVPKVIPLDGLPWESGG